MEKRELVQSVLKLEGVLFDKIEFNRLGLPSNEKLELEFQSNIMRKQEEDEFKVTIMVKGKKPEEYTFEISLTGYFAFETEEKLEEQMKNALITKNSIAILMPYLRSEVSLLTAQPGVECVVLPAFNINKTLEK